ncbi:uncharacterized protein Hap1MRO34_020159 [Clarias gariepinus]
MDAKACKCVSGQCVREMCKGVARPLLQVSKKHFIHHSSRPSGGGMPATNKNEEKTKKTKRKMHATSGDQECRRMSRSLHQHISQILSNYWSCRLWTNLLDIHHKSDVADEEAFTGNGPIL